MEKVIQIDGVNYQLVEFNSTPKDSIDLATIKYMKERQLHKRQLGDKMGEYLMIGCASLLGAFILFIILDAMFGRH